MAHSVHVAKLEAWKPATPAAARHPGFVRVTHWLNAISFLGLVISGVGILLAHPRFYWGETGGVGTPSILDLPLPFMLGGPSGWGRYLHFESAWLGVLSGIVYVLSGVAGGHFRRNLVPVRGESSLRSLTHALVSNLLFERPSPESALSYNILQRVTYLAVIFVWFPLMIWTGLAMSPAVTSVFPGLVTSLGGHECARTIHFFAAILLVVFAVIHLAMVWRAGFRSRVGAMITGRLAREEDR